MYTEGIQTENCPTHSIMTQFNKKVAEGLEGGEGTGGGGQEMQRADTYADVEKGFQGIR